MWFMLQSKNISVIFTGECNPPETEELLAYSKVQFIQENRWPYQSTPLMDFYSKNWRVIFTEQIISHSYYKDRIQRLWPFFEKGDTNGDVFSNDIDKCPGDVLPGNCKCGWLFGKSRKILMGLCIWWCRNHVRIPRGSKQWSEPVVPLAQQDTDLEMVLLMNYDECRTPVKGWTVDVKGCAENQQDIEWWWLFWTI